MSLNFFANTEETETFYLVEPNDFNKKGFFVRVKKRLSWGERRRLEMSMVKNFSPSQMAAASAGQTINGAESEEVGGTMTYGLDMAVPSFLKLACYIVDWNLTTDDGSTVRLPRTLDEKARLMERLDAETGDRISLLIDGMVGEQVKALEAAKEKDEDGESLNGTVVSRNSRLIEGRLVEGEDPNSTPPPVGRTTSGGSRRA
jgi:hypothetical protein